MLEPVISDATLIPIWLTVAIVSTVYCLVSWLWDKNPRGDILATYWMGTTFFFPYLVVLASMVAMAAVPLLIMRGLRRSVQEFKHRVNG